MNRVPLPVLLVAAAAAGAAGAFVVPMVALDEADALAAQVADAGPELKEPGMAQAELNRNGVTGSFVCSGAAWIVDDDGQRQRAATFDVPCAHLSVFDDARGAATRVVATRERNACRAKVATGGVITERDIDCALVFGALAKATPRRALKSKDIGIDLADWPDGGVKLTP